MDTILETNAASAALTANNVPTVLDYPGSFDVFLRFAQSQEQGKDNAPGSIEKAAQDLAELLDRAQYDAMKAGWNLCAQGQPMPTV